MANDDFREVGRNAIPESMLVLGQDTYQDFQSARAAENSILIGLGAYVHALFGTPTYCDSRANLDDCILVRTDNGIKCMTMEKVEVFNINFADKTLTIQCNTDKKFQLKPNGVQRSDGTAVNANDSLLIKNIRDWLGSFNPDNADIRSALSLFPSKTITDKQHGRFGNKSVSAGSRSLMLASLRRYEIENRSNNFLQGDTGLI